MMPCRPTRSRCTESLLTLDTHIDIPWPTGPDPFEDGTRRVDLPKMRRGGLSAGCFVAYVPQAARTPETEHARLRPRHRDAADRSTRMGRSEAGITARVATSVAERSRRRSATASWRSCRRGERLRHRHRPVAARALPRARRALPDPHAQRPQRAGGFLQSAQATSAMPRKSMAGYRRSGARRSRN